MKIYLLTFIENSEKSRVYDDLLCWLRASMISWHAYPEKLEYTLFDDIYTNYSMAYPNGQVIAQTHELNNIQQRLSMLKIKNTYTKVLVAGRKGWQAARGNCNRCNGNGER